MSPRKRRPRSRRTNYGPVILVAVICFTLVIAGGFAFVLVKRQRGTGGRDERTGSGPATSELAAAVAETDKLDPRWRLADLVKARVKLDPERDSAPLAISAARQVQSSALTALDGHEPRGDPAQPVPEFEVQRLRSLVRSYGPAVAEARRMADYSTGQFEINFNFQNPLDTKLEPETHVQKTAYLLFCDSRLRAAEGDASGAVRSSYALFVLARCYNDDPFLISYLARVGMNSIAIDALERALTCAAVSDNELTALQGLLEGQAAETLVLALRGERAARHATIEAKTFAGGDVSPSSHAWFLRTMNRAIGLAGKGGPYYSPEWSSYLDDLRSGPEDGRRITPALDKVRDASARQAAILRTAAVAVAAERYRRAAGTWPTYLRNLVPDYISSLPTDPYTGNPIQSAQTQQGFTVYVKGLAASASGEFGAIGAKPENCQGFRLLNPERRRARTGN
jgi:hypothetical protein